MTVQNPTNWMGFGLSTDTKPTNRASNALFVETDTKTIKRWNGSSWVSLLTSGGSSAYYDYLVYYTGTQYEAMNSKTGAVAFSNTTDAGAVINSCINAIQPSTDPRAVDKKGSIFINPGTYAILTTITPKNHILIQGSGMQSTLLELGSTLNIDMFKSFGFNDATYGTGTNSPYGNVDVTIRDLSLSGAAWNNLTAGCGIRKYGFAWLLENVEIKNFREQGIYTEWCTSGGTSYADDDVHEQQEQWHNLQFFKNFGGGVLHRGPHDSTASNCSWAGNTGYGLKIEHLNSVYTGEIHLHHCHIWDQNGTNSRGVWVSGGKLHFTDLIIETVDTQAAGGIGLYADGGVARGSYLWIFACDTGVNIQNPGPCSLENVHIENNTLGMTIEGNDHYITGRVINNNNPGNTAGTGVKFGRSGLAITRNYVVLQIQGSKTEQILWAENNWDNFLYFLVYAPSPNKTVTETVAMNLSSNVVQILESGNGTLSGWGRPVNETNGATLYNKTLNMRDQTIFQNDAANAAAWIWKAGGNLSGGNKYVILPVMTADDTVTMLATVQTLTNKTILADKNTFSGIPQDPNVIRTGWTQNISPASGTTAAGFLNVNGILANYTPTGAGTNSQAWDTTEGLITTLASSTTASAQIGLVPPAGGIGVTRRAFATRARIRSKIDSTTSGRYYFGFSSANVLPAGSDTVVANGDSAILVGFSTASTNWTIYTHAGSGPATQTNVTGPIAKNAAYHTIEISWTAGGNAVITFDGVSQTVSTDLPATTTNLFFHAVAQNSTTTARSHLIKGIWIEVAG